MNQKRLITTSVISIFLVAILLIGSTYSIFFSKQIDPNSNIYTTGNLDITYTIDESNIKFDNIIPIPESEIETIKPYRMSIINKGTVPYKFNIILNSTTSNSKNEIDKQYIMTKVGELENKALSDCKDNIIKDNIIISAGESIEVDIRLWLSDQIKNTEIGKSFYAKLVIDGLAIYDNEDEIDNSNLSLNYLKTLFNDSKDDKYYKNSNYKDKIISANFVDFIDTSKAILDENRKPIFWDLSKNDDNSIIAWLEESSLEKYNLYIGSNQKIYAEDINNLFSNMSNLKEVNLTNLSLNLSTNLNNMFSNSINLNKIDLIEIDTKNTIDISNMFLECSNLTTTIVIKNATVSNYTDIFTNAATKNNLIEIKYNNKTKTLIEEIIKTVATDSNIKMTNLSE